MPEPFKQLSPYEQEYYLDKSVQNNLTRNANEAAQEQAKMIKMGGMKDPNAEKPYPWGQVAGGGQGPGRDWVLAPKSAGGGGYDPGPGPQAIVPTYMMPYKKTPKNNLNKTTKQIRAAIYTLKKPKDLTKSQKIAIAEMFGKQIVTKPTKKQKTPR
jgi:hypothetical protein